MSTTRTKLAIVAIVAMSLALITASAFAPSTVVAKTSHKKSSSGTSGSSSGTGSSTGTSSSSSSTSSGSTSTSSNPNSLTKKELNSFIKCVNNANKQPTGLSNKIIRDCYDQARGITTTATAAAGGTIIPGTTGANTATGTAGTAGKTTTP